MRNILILSSMILFLLTFSYGAKDSESVEGKELTMDKALRDRLVARVDGKEINLSDIDYDIQKRYDFELHTLEVKLYREQRVKLNKMINQMLLEKEAEKRKTTPDDLLALINLKSDKGTNEIEGDREKLYQDSLDNFKKVYPGFSKMPEAMQLEILKRVLGIESNFKGSLREEVKNKIVEIKKSSVLRNKKNEFFEELRAKAEIEFLLERPELIHLDISPDDDPYLGSKDAKITLIEFADYQCPFCSKAQPVLEDLLAKQGDKIKLIFRDLPLPSHKNAKIAAEAAECADDQGKFWEYNDLLFDNQKSLDVESLSEYAKSIGLDLEKFNQCLDSGRQGIEVEKDIADAKLAGIRSTPTILINGYYISGVPSVAYLEEVIADIERGQIPREQEDRGKG